MTDTSQELGEAFITSTLAGLVACASPTGREEEAARFLGDVMARCGFDVSLQHVSERSRNVVGRLRGAGTGPDLLLVGHLDTSYSGEEDELVGAGFKPEPVMEDGHLVGLGSWNMKSGLVAGVTAAARIAASGVQLPGDLVVAGVAGEIEKIGVGEFTGPEYEGYGVGARYLTSHGVTADSCIVLEPTGFKVGVARHGAAWFRVDVRGDYVHAARSRAQGLVLAVEEAHHVISAIRAWGDRWAVEKIHRGTEPPVTIGGIRAGEPWRASRTPATVSIYLDVRYPPTLTAADVQRELRGVLTSLGSQRPTLEFSLDCYMVAEPTEVAENEPVVRAIQAASQRALGRPAEPYCRDVMDDTGHFTSVGVPAVSMGVGRPAPEIVRKHGGEAVRLRDVVELADLVEATVHEYMATPND